MAFEIHMREFFDDRDEAAGSRIESSGQLAWRIVSVIAVAGILLGLAFLFFVRPSGVAAADAYGIHEPFLSLAAGEEAQAQVRGATLQGLDRSVETPPRPDAVVVASVAAGSPAAAKGLREGDIIVAANREPVHSIEDLTRIADNVDGVLMLDVLRGQAPLVVLIH